MASRRSWYREWKARAKPRSGASQFSISFCRRQTRTNINDSCRCTSLMWHQTEPNWTKPNWTELKKIVLFLNIFHQRVNVSSATVRSDDHRLRSSLNDTHSWRLAVLQPLVLGPFLGCRCFHFSSGGQVGLVAHQYAWNTDVRKMSSLAKASLSRWTKKIHKTVFFVL